MDPLKGFHRITEWLELEATFQDHLVQPFCQGHGHLSLGQVGQSPIQHDLEHFLNTHLEVTGVSVQPFTSGQAAGIGLPTVAAIR